MPNHHPVRETNHFGNAEKAEAETLEQRAQQMYGLQTTKRRGRMTVIDDKGIEFGAFRLTAVGLLVPEDTIPSEDNWWEMVVFVARVYGWSQLLIGDALLYGERVHGKTVKEVAAALNLREETIRDWIWVCASVDLSVRTDVLEYSHYVLVAKFEPKIQAYWLGRAAENRWTVARLRKELNGGDPPALPAPSVWGNKNELNIVKQMATWTPETFTQADAKRREELKLEIEVVYERLKTFYQWLEG